MGYSSDVPGECTQKGHSEYGQERRSCRKCVRRYKKLVAVDPFAVGKHPTRLHRPHATYGIPAVGLENRARQILCTVALSLTIKPFMD